MSFDNVKSINDESPLIENVDRKHKSRSIRVCYAFMFFSSVNYSIQMTSLWPYMENLNSESTKDFLGWVVSAYSFGQLFACPLFSFITGRTNKFCLMFILSVILSICGNYLYTILADISSNYNQNIALLASRVIMGISGGAVAAIRLFLTLSTTPEERIGPMAFLSASQALGFIVGPGLQAIFSQIKQPIDINYLHINIYTACSFFNIVTNILLLFLLLFFFSEKFLEKKRDESDPDTEEDSFNVGNSKFENEYKLAISMLGAFFMCMMSLSIVETIVTPLTMDNFAWSKVHATLINSILLAVSGFCSLGVFVSLKFIAKRIKESTLLLLAFLIILLAGAALIPFGYEYIPISYEVILNGNETTLSTILLQLDNGTGCDLLKQPWCEHVPCLQFWQFITSLCLFTIGYPAGNILSYVIFSRLIDPKSQSLWMGLLTAAGSSARILGPLFISNLYHLFGTQIAFGSWSCFLLVFLLGSPFFIIRMRKYERRNARIDDATVNN